ncbi:hypothetical protein M9458_057985, partial [Cirrhinus mrigala]
MNRAATHFIKRLMSAHDCCAPDEEQYRIKHCHTAEQLEMDPVHCISSSRYINCDSTFCCIKSVVESSFTVTHIHTEQKLHIFKPVSIRAVQHLNTSEQTLLIFSVSVSGCRQ